MTNQKIKLGIVGVGKIVHDQHLPSIEKTGQYQLVATASRNGSVPGVPAFKDIEAMLQAQPEIEAVALCMPPQYRYQAAATALSHGVDVLLEKPPGATICEVEQLERIALDQSCQLYATWHSRHASAVATAKQWLAEDQLKVLGVHIEWKEDVRKWHPGQEWIWQAGGLGVFDPGINGLSILTHILPSNFFARSAVLEFPENKAAPIAAKVNFVDADGVDVFGDFDWRESGDEKWRIKIDTSKGELVLDSGGDALFIDGRLISTPRHSEHGEYEAIYAHFAALIRERRSDIDLQPLKLVADAFLCGEHKRVNAFLD